MTQFPRHERRYPPLRRPDRDVDIAECPKCGEKAASARRRVFTAAAPPPEAVLGAMRGSRINVTHLYGLTETYGPAVVNDWHAEWDALDPAAQAAKKARQGVRYLALEALDIIDPGTMQPVPADGVTMGEAMFRGNVVMKGYLKNAKASQEAFAGGWFHSGDLGVKHPDGYIQLKDRSKTSSFRAAKTFRLSRSKTLCSSTLPCKPPPWWPSLTTSGVRPLALSWN